MKSQKYLSNIFCNKHPEERLNLVCIEKKCFNRGLICQLCKSDDDQYHFKHYQNIIPFKYFIQSLQANLGEKLFESLPKDQHPTISKLSTIRDEMLARLSLVVQEVADTISKVEQKIINDFLTSKEKILQKSSIFSEYKSCIQKCIIHNIRKEQKFQLIQQVKQIVGHVTVAWNKQAQYKYMLDLKNDQVMADFKEQSQYLKINCQRFQLNVKSIFQTKSQLIYQKYQEEKRNKEIRNAALESKLKLQEKHNQQKLKDQKSILQKAKEERIQKKNIKKKIKDDKKKQSPILQQKIQTPPSNKQQKKVQIPSALSGSIFSFLTKEQTTQILTKKAPKVSFQDLMKDQQDYEKHQVKQVSKSTIFSSLFKGITIKITKQGRYAKQTASEQASAGFVITSQTLEKCKKIAFKIAKIKTEVFIGIAKQEALSAKKYLFTINSLNTASCMINSKGVICSFHNQTQPSNQLFLFNENDIINVLFVDGKLIFQRHAAKKAPNDKPKSITLLTGIKQAETRHFNFCVFLAGSGDCVEII